MNPQLLINIFDDDSLYEIYLSGTIIRRIVRYSGSNQFARDLQWSDLSEEVKQKVIDKVIEERNSYG